MNDTVLLEVKDGVATLTLNRPQAANVMNNAMVDALREATGRLEFDPGVRCVVIHGAGEHFMGGGDLQQFYQTLEQKPAERRASFEHFIHHMHPVVVSLRRMPKPVLASIHGAVAGFGVSLVAVCDLAIAADNSFFSLAYCHIGTSPDGGSTFYLPRILGLRRAMEVALLGERFDAATALSYGLLNRVVPAADLGATTAKLATQLAHGPTRAYGNTKRLLNAALQSTLDSQLQAEAESFAECAAGVDFAEGVTAFVEKRQPQFRGN